MPRPATASASPAGSPPLASRDLLCVAPAPVKYSKRLTTRSKLRGKRATDLVWTVYTAEKKTEVPLVTSKSTQELMIIGPRPVATAAPVVDAALTTLASTAKMSLSFLVN